MTKNEALRAEATKLANSATEGHPRRSAIVVLLEGDADETFAVHIVAPQSASKQAMVKTLKRVTAAFEGN